MKICVECGTPKPLSEFTRCSFSADGHRHRCRECTTPPTPPRRTLVYEYDRTALKSQLPFLRQYGKRSLSKKPAIIVSMPARQRKELERFCDLIGMERDGIFPLPRHESGHHIGVILYGAWLAGDLVLYKGFLSRAYPTIPATSRMQAAA